MHVVRSEERDFLLRHRNGDRGAFAELVAEYRAPVYSYLLRCGVGEDDRDDLFQEAFLRIHRAADSYRDDRPVHPWIFTIVANAVRSHLRRQRIRHLVHSDPSTANPAAEPADTAPDGERRSAARQRVALVEQEIRELPPVQREVVLLACVEQLAQKEIAAALEIPLNTVKTHLRRARLALAGALSRRERGEVTS
jgi:RNA polymerase sigma-70 factor (ECF subfamily)